MRFIRKILRAVDARLLSATAKRARAERITYLGPERLRRLERWAKGALRAASGDVLEFGVAMGGSAILLAEHAVAHDRRFAGFDIFGMIPPPSSDKDDEKSKERYEVIAAGKSEGIGGDIYYGYQKNLLEEVSGAFDRFGIPVDGDRIQLVKGLFEDTWPLYGAKEIAFAHIDCDWYDPVKYCLESVSQKIGSGGVIVLDDYHDYGGCRAATDEFLAKRQDFEFIDGANVVLRRKN